MKRLRASIAVAALLVAALVPAIANAQSKSWAAAKGIAPADAAFVIGANITTIQKSSIYQALVPAMISKEPDAKKGLEDIKTVCAIDVTASITDVTVVVLENEKVLMVAGLSKGIDEAKALACLQKLSEREKKGKLTSTKSGKITEYSMAGEKDKLYIAWLAKDVIAMTSDPTDKALLEKMIGGKGLSGDLAKTIGKVNTNAAVWGAGLKKMPVGKAGTAKGGYGSLDLAAGVLSLDLRIVMSSAAEAKKAMEDAQKDMAKSKGQMPPEMQKIMDATKIGTSGDELTVKLSLTEKEAMSLIGMMMAAGM
jgi:hypothetical protein